MMRDSPDTHFRFFESLNLQLTQISLDEKSGEGAFLCEQSRCKTACDADLSAEALAKAEAAQAA